MLYYDNGYLIDTSEGTEIKVTEPDLVKVLQTGQLVHGVSLSNSGLSYYDWRKANLLKFNALHNALIINEDGQLAGIRQNYPNETIDLNMFGEPATTLAVYKYGLVILPIKSPLLQFGISGLDSYAVDISGLNYLYAMPYVMAILRHRTVNYVSVNLELKKHLWADSGAIEDLHVIYSVIRGVILKAHGTLKELTDSKYSFVHTYLSDLYAEYIRNVDFSKLECVRPISDTSDKGYKDYLGNLAPILSFYFPYLLNAINVYGCRPELTSIVDDFSSRLRCN